MIDGINHTGNCGHFPANPSSSTDEHARRTMSAFASWLVVPPQLGWLMASAPFHVCQRSGFSPDRADYLSRQAKLNFTSVERRHKASLSGSPPLTSQHPPAETKGLSDRHLPEEARHVPLSSKPSAERCHVAAAKILKRGHARQNPTLQTSTFVKTKAECRGAAAPLRFHHLYPTCAACTDAPHTQIRPRISASTTLVKISSGLVAEEHSG